MFYLFTLQIGKIIVPFVNVSDRHSLDVTIVILNSYKLVSSKAVKFLLEESLTVISDNSLLPSFITAFNFVPLNFTRNE